MKLALVALFALVPFAAVAQQPAFYGCETVDMGGYLNFADPTCPAAVTGTQADYMTETREVFDNQGNVIDTFEIEVSTSNK